MILCNIKTIKTIKYDFFIKRNSGLLSGYVNDEIETKYSFV